MLLDSPWHDSTLPTTPRTLDDDHSIHFDTSYTLLPEKIIMQRTSYHDYMATSRLDDTQLLMPPRISISGISRSSELPKTKDVRPPTLQSYQSHRSFAIPLIDFDPFPRHGTIKQGRLLCSKSMEWFSHGDVLNIRRHKTRLRWREFKVVLRPDRLLLYMLSAVLPHKQRLAHTIFFVDVQLSLVNTLDYIWRLQYRNRAKGTTAYLFEAANIAESQAWYMTLYRLLPSQSVKSIPPSIDLHIPDLEMTIRIPLHLAPDQTIFADDVKESVLSLLEDQGHHLDHMRLCWRRDNSIEWLDHEPGYLGQYLIGPQLIEKTHVLELRSPTDDSSTSPEMASTMEGFVFRWTDDQGRTLKHRQHVYVLMEAHYMFLIDASKAILPSEQIPSVSNKSFNWLTSASTLLRIDRHWRRKAFASTPAFEDQKSLSKEELEKDVQRRMKQIALAYGVIDLSVMKDVRFGTDSDLDAQGNKCFQIDVEKRLLQFEAPSAQAMFSWVMKIRRMHQHSKRMQRQTFMMTNYLSETDQKKSILYSGMLYIKRHHYGTFKQWLCILTRDKQLLLFRRHQRRRWTQEAIYLGAYSKQQRLLLADAYTFHAAEEEHTNDIECPPRVFHDLSTGRETNDSCVFVIWQGAKRRYVVQWREYLNLLKLGHHLGRRGHIWICLARTREERNAWIWAIHCSQDIR